MAERIIAIIATFLALSASSPALHEISITFPIVADFLQSTLFSSESACAS